MLPDPFSVNETKLIARQELQQKGSLVQLPNISTSSARRVLTMKKSGGKIETEPTVKKIQDIMLEYKLIEYTILIKDSLLGDKNSFQSTTYCLGS